MKKDKKELKKSVFHIQSILDMFLAKDIYNKLHHLASFFDLLPFSILS